MKHAMDVTNKFTKTINNYMNVESARFISTLSVLKIWAFLISKFGAVLAITNVNFLIRSKGLSVIHVENVHRRVCITVTRTSANFMFANSVLIQAK